VLAGFGDRRELELLVEAGFAATEAIQIGTAQGAQVLAQSARIGTLLPGKGASTKIDDIERVEIVFKNGIGYDSTKLIESVRGLVGLR
jgi:imidazolonepropionase-like amidohydrolase